MANRLPSISPDSATPAQLEALRDIQRDRGLSGAQVGAMFAMLLASPEAARHVGKVGAHCRFHTALPPALRETAILAATCAIGFDLEIRIHEPLAVQSGVAAADVAALGRTDHDALPAELADVARLAHAIAAGVPLTDAIFNAARTRFGDGGAIDIAVTAGYYLMLGRISKALMPG